MRFTTLLITAIICTLFFSELDALRTKSAKAMASDASLAGCPSGTHVKRVCLPDNPSVCVRTCEINSQRQDKN